jgi:hypothetical protein
MNTLGYGFHHNPATAAANMAKQQTAIMRSIPQGVIPRAMGGPIDFGNSGSFNAAPGDWNSFNAAVAKMEEQARPKATGNMPNRFGPRPLTAAFIPFGDGKSGGGGGGGGGGRMAPQDPNKRIGTRVGPRTAAEYTAEQGGLSPQRPSTLDAAYQSGAITSGFKPAPTGNQGNPLSNGATPMEQGGGYNLAPDAFDKPAQPTERLAKGGAMKIGQKPYLVGEEGPELIMPRANGDGYVLPADVTQQLLPMMTKRPTPRQQGGIMEMITPNATFSGGATPYGPVYGMRQTESQLGSPQPMTMEEAGLAMQPDQRMIVDNGYQVDLPALRAGDAQSIPLQPDVVTGPWASPAMPADTTGLQPYLQNQVSRLSMTGAKPVSKYPGMVFEDISNQARYDNAIKAGQTEEAAMAYSETDVIPSSDKFKVGFEEMQQRMALRGMMYGDDYRDRQNRDRVQQDLANRAARAPIGTPTMLPGQGSEARIQANLARERERLSRTPQGAQFLAQQQQEMDMLTQRSRLASTAIPVKDAAGNILGYTTGTGASLPALNNRPRQVQRTVEVDGTMYNVYEDGSAAPISGLPTAAPKQQFIDSTTGRIVEFDADIDTSSLDPNQFTPVSRKPTPATPGTATSTAGPVKVNSPEEARALKPGTKFITSEGRTGTR